MATLSPFRVCSTVIWRTADITSDALIIEGVASNAAADLAGDVIEPKGATFELPMPLLMQHNKEKPVGKVTAAKVSDSEIRIVAEFSKASSLPYVNEAREQVREGLVSGLSIGAQPLKAEPILDRDGRMTGVRYTAWRWLELSAVTIPMNHKATIDVVRMFDPWGAAAFAVSRDPLADLTGPKPEGQTTEAIRARAQAAMKAARAALYR
jgi:HK97 family phage prohead protease